MALSRLSEILRGALDLAREDPTAALDALDRGLAGARLAGDQESVARMAKHAGALASSIGQHERALGYLREVARLQPHAPLVQLAVAMVLRDLGRDEEAQSAFFVCAKLAAEHEPETARLAMGAALAFGGKRRAGGAQ